MFYLDTSFIVAALTQDEGSSEQARQWLDVAVSSSLIISDWVITEVSSAFAAKVRLNQFSLDQRADALLQWRILQADSLELIAIQREDFQVAAEFAGRHKLFLRSGDALHLAVAKRVGCTLVTLDKRMAAAALELGVPVAAVSDV